MKLILLGPPGSGKGTVASDLVATLHTQALTSSMILKEEIRQGTQTGLTMKQFMDAGRLVPDDLVIQAILEKLDNLESYILDGFPRTIAQAKALDEKLGEADKKIDHVIYLDLPLEVAKQRNMLRTTCKVCGFSPMPDNTVCPKCSGELIKRVDDEEATILKRLTTYVNETAPLVDFYSIKGKLLKIDANASIDVVKMRILSALGVA
ncbi:MAG: nucleoside monophosphate kinase [Caldiserica bacterium]|nr:nucleoside monophosphate kinase [Caldisericota bacterium]